MRISPFIATAALIIVAGCTQTEISHADFRIGDSKSEILQQFGEPDGILAIRKEDEEIWGAIESVWSTVSLGSVVEIWMYDSVDPSMGNGQTELYFINGSESVDGIGFNPEGAVFESGA